jgi:hypothetical protein
MPSKGVCARPIVDERAACNCRCVVCKHIIALTTAQQHCVVDVHRMPDTITVMASAFDLLAVCTANVCSLNRVSIT